MISYHRLCTITLPMCASVCERRREGERERGERLTFGTELVFFLLLACCFHAAFANKPVKQSNKDTIQMFVNVLGYAQKWS